MVVGSQVKEMLSKASKRVKSRSASGRSVPRLYKEQEMSPPTCLSEPTSAALSLSKLSCSSWPGQKRVSGPEAFPAIIAVVLTRVDKGPIRVLNAHPLSGHSY